MQWCSSQLGVLARDARCPQHRRSLEAAEVNCHSIEPPQTSTTHLAHLSSPLFLLQFPLLACMMLEEADPTWICKSAESTPGSFRPPCWLRSKPEAIVPPFGVFKIGDSDLRQGKRTLDGPPIERKAVVLIRNLVQLCSNTTKLLLLTFYVNLRPWAVFVCICCQALVCLCRSYKPQK